MTDQKQKCTPSNGRGERRHYSSPAPRLAADAQGLRMVLDRENSMRKYRSSISSILGDTVATSLFEEDSGAATIILEGIYVVRRGDASSTKTTGDLGHGRIFKIGGSCTSRTGRRRGNSSSVKMQLNPPFLPNHESHVRKSQACVSASDGSPRPSRNGMSRDDSLAQAWKIKDDSGHACTARSHSSSKAVAEGAGPSSPDDSPVFAYAVGDTRASRRHSLPFASPSQAAAELAALPLWSPLFARRSDRRFTYAILAERRDGRDGGLTSLVVALDESGTQKKVLERRHWQTCLRLVRTGPASATKNNLE